MEERRPALQASLPRLHLGHRQASRWLTRMNVSESNPSRFNEWRDYLVLTALGAGLLGALLSLMLPLQYPFANDTAGYVQEAQKWLSGEGLLRGTGWSNTTQDFATFPLFPPGFSLEIAGLSKLGLSLPHAALAASWLAWLLLLPAIAFTLRPLVGRWTAMAIAVLAASSPGFVEYGYLALSDSGMVLFSVMSLGILLRQNCSQGANWRAMVLSGLLAGCAYMLRNAAAVLPLTVIAFLGLSLLSKRLDLRAVLRSGLLWGAGFAVFALPLFFYNFQTFGSIQPYFEAHGAIEFGALRAFRVTLWSFLLDISAWRTIADTAWSAMAMSTLLLPAGFLLIWAGWKSWKQSSHLSQSALLLLLLYMSIGFAIIVWGRSRFDWVEVTLTRQIMPYSWVALAVMIWALRPHRTVAFRFAQISTVIFVFAGLFLLAGRLNNIWADLVREAAIQSAVDTYGYAGAADQFPGAVLTNHIKQNTSRDHILINLLKNLPADAHIVSNHGPILSLASGRHIRRFAPTPENLEELVVIRPQLGGRPLVLVIIPSNEILRGPQAVTWQENVLNRLGAGYEILLKTKNFLVVRLL